MCQYITFPYGQIQRVNIAGEKLWELVARFLGLEGEFDTLNNPAGSELDGCSIW